MQLSLLFIAKWQRTPQAHLSSCTPAQLPHLPRACTLAGQWKGKDTQLSTCDASGKKPLTDKGPHLQVKESAEVRRRGGCTCMRVMGCISHRCLLFLLHWYPW